ncbi:MAG: ParB/RepB/Spo0J family partition protein [Mariniphaga sp.]|nr:ParB/RepB/Spo0J family partition protein [Mariniphaga sp.]
MKNLILDGMEMDNFYDIPINEIEVDDINVRKHNREDRIDELARSINRHGLMQPILLFGNAGKPPYKIIVGQRRLLAHQKLSKETIKATFSGEIEPIEATLLSLAENMQRVDLNHADKADHITILYNHYGKDEHQVAEALGLSVRTIRDYVKIGEQATDKAKELLKSEKVSKADVKRAIDAAQGDEEKADILLEEIGKLSKYDKSRAVEYGKENPEATAEKIIEVGQKPKVQETIFLKLPKRITKAIRKASKKLYIDIEDLALKALEEWLERNDFIS